LLSIWGFLIVGAVVGYLYITLPSLEGATKLKRGPTAALMARDGAFIASYGELRGEMATVAALPSHLPRAVIAIEDRRFYEHGGIDPRGVARAAEKPVRRCWRSNWNAALPRTRSSRSI
jgi:penicillin-binding protein 1A